MQVLVHVDVVCTDRLADFADDLLRQTDLAGDLNGEGATRATNREAEERAHLVTVIEHGPVDEASMLLGISLEVLIVRGDDTEGTSIIEAMEESLCNSPADRRLRTATKFVDEQQASCSALTDKVLHIAQVRTVGT